MRLLSVGGSAPAYAQPDLTVSIDADDYTPATP
jgi:hypothetical protein